VCQGGVVVGCLLSCGVTVSSGLSGGGSCRRWKVDSLCFYRVLREGRSLLREGAVVKRLGCRWVYKRELSILKESEGYFYTIRNQFGSSLWWEAPSGDFYI
jgi:hypothetical protein